MKFSLPGVSCEDLAYCRISTEEECLTVATSFKIRDRVRKQSKSNKVGGCYVNSREKLYFNSDRAPESRSLSGESLFCKPCKIVPIPCTSPTTTTTTCADPDRDGICSGLDSCPLDPNNDSDGDRICGDVDPCPFDSDNDFDSDGLCGDVDICPADASNDEDRSDWQC